MDDSEALKRVAASLGDVKQHVVFVGGMVRTLLVTDPAAASPRPTHDVDMVLDVDSLTELQSFNARLRRAGF